MSRNRFQSLFCPAIAIALFGIVAGCSSTPKESEFEELYATFSARAAPDYAALEAERAKGMGEAEYLRKRKELDDKITRRVNSAIFTSHELADMNRNPGSSGSDAEDSAKLLEGNLLPSG